MTDKSTFPLLDTINSPDDLRDMSEYKRSLGAIRKGSTVLFLIKRGGTTIYIAVKIK